ncbi:MAG: UDP-2,3-diacylglucosamine diphosphatase LpxI domain-containing protein, partial [Planctomycetota bacterium]
EPSLSEHVDHFFYGAIARPGGWMRKLRRHGVSETIMVGRVAKKQIYTPWRIIKYLPDWRAIRIWYGRLRGMDKRNDTVLCAIADELASGGIILEDSTMHCKEHLATEGVMTQCQPPASVWEDIKFGWELVKQCGKLDIGQAIAVREREIIAVEAIEGTDSYLFCQSRSGFALGCPLRRTGFDLKINDKWRYVRFRRIRQNHHHRQTRNPRPRRQSQHRRRWLLKPYFISF